MAKHLKKHSVLSGLQNKNGALLWHDMVLPAIVDKVGSTPFYAYDRDRMTQRVSELRQHMPEDLDIHYAMKANPMPAVVEHMSSLVDGLDVASGGELEVALASGIKATNISFAGPGKRDGELKQAIDSGITINVESANELQRIARIADTAGSSPQVAIRVNPAFGLKSSGMKMGGHASQFGVDAEQVPDLLRTMQGLEIDFRGFHVYSGSQTLLPDAIQNTLQQTTDLVMQLAGNSDTPLSYVNLGGGLGIPYFAGEEALDLSTLSEPFAVATSQLRRAFGDIEIVMELGRYLVGEAGIYVTRVVDIKQSRGKNFVICDGGLNHHLAASGNFGQILRKDYPLVLGNRMDEPNVVAHTIVGPLCTPLDLLGNNVLLPMVDVGDLIVILQSGAYGFSASPTAFLSHPAPAEVLL